MAFGAPGNPLGGALPAGQSPYPWLSNWLGGFGIPSGTSSNGLPQIGTPQGGSFQPSMPQTPQMSPLPNSMGQPGGGMMGMPFWMQMLGMNRPQAQPVPQPQPLSPLLSQPQMRPPIPQGTPAAAPVPTAPPMAFQTNGQGGIGSMAPLSPAQQQQAALLIASGLPPQIANNQAIFGGTGPNYAGVANR